MAHLIDDEIVDEWLEDQEKRRKKIKTRSKQSITHVYPKGLDDYQNED